MTKQSDRDIIIRMASELAAVNARIKELEKNQVELQAVKERVALIVGTMPMRVVSSIENGAIVQRQEPDMAAMSRNTTAKMHAKPRRKRGAV